MKERLQKVLANLGLGSRREVENWISEGRIKVDGETAILGCQVDGTENITLDGRKVEISNEQQERRVLIYYKPEGEITSRHDPEGRPTIFDSLPRISQGRWITVGRLDINTQGLLLVTNDGELAHRLMHPSHELEREYAVRVIGDFTDEMADNMRNGIEFEDGVSKFEEILWSGGTGANFWYHVTVKGGKNREVRRLWESQGLMVSRLIRIRYGNVELPKGLREGQFIDIDPETLKELVESVGLEHQRVVLDEKTERQRSKARRVSGSQRERRAELSRDHRSSERRSNDRNRSEGRSFNRDGERRSFGDRDNRSNDRNNDRNRSEGRSFNRDGERRSFGDRDNRSNDRNRSEGRSFNRDGERRSFGDRDNRNNDRRSNDRSNDRNRSEGRSFNRDGERRSFGDRDNRSNDRNRSEGRSFNRDGERRSFGDRDNRNNDRRSNDRSNDRNRSEGRSFNRDGERRSFGDRDNRNNDRRGSHNGERFERSTPKRTRD